MPKPERPVQLSIIDRLIDERPGDTADVPTTRSQSVARLKASVLRDLSMLLNTRLVTEGEAEEAAYPQLRQSLHYYGLRDETALEGGAVAARTRLVRRIEDAVRLFEPRLTAVRVFDVEPDDAVGALEFRFVIEAILTMDPEPERVVFDAVRDSMNGGFRVVGDGHA